MTNPMTTPPLTDAPVDVEALAKYAQLSHEDLHEKYGDDGEVCHRCRQSMRCDPELDLSPFCNTCGHAAADELGAEVLRLLDALAAAREDAKEWRTQHDNALASWDVDRKNLAARIDAVIAERDAARWADETRRKAADVLVAQLDAAREERDQWRRDYLDVADAIMRESANPQQLADEARRLRRVENEIRAAQEEALRQSLGADLAVRERDDLRAQLAAATARVAEVERAHEQTKTALDYLMWNVDGYDDTKDWALRIASGEATSDGRSVHAVDALAKGGRPVSKRTWADFTWPDWVPQECREQIEGFWSDAWGRGPDAWLAAAQEPYNYRDDVEFGERVTLRGVCGDWGKDEVTGRYVYAWNNIGRIVTDDGRTVCVANGRRKDVLP